MPTQFYYAHLGEYLICVGVNHDLGGVRSRLCVEREEGSHKYLANKVQALLAAYGGERYPKIPKEWVEPPGGTTEFQFFAIRGGVVVLKGPFRKNDLLVCVGFGQGGEVRSFSCNYGGPSSEPFLKRIVAYSVWSAEN